MRNTLGTLQGGRMRLRTGVCFVGFALCCVALLSLSGCVYSNPITGSDVAQLKARIVQAYPGWVIERVYTQGNQGWYLAKGATASAVLRWPGPQDFRFKLGFYYGFGTGQPDWDSPAASLFQDPVAATAFITAFKRRHPEPGVVVNLHGQGGRGETVASIMNAGPQGEVFEVSLWTGPEYAASNGSLGGSDPFGHLEYWRATETSAGVAWTPMLPGGS
jgi:hypothetical protein